MKTKLFFIHLCIVAAIGLTIAWTSVAKPMNYEQQLLVGGACPNCDCAAYTYSQTYCGNINSDCTMYKHDIDCTDITGYKYFKIYNGSECEGDNSACAEIVSEGIDQANCTATN